MAVERDGAAASHPLSVIVARLWATKGVGQDRTATQQRRNLDARLFAQRLHIGYGVFAVQEADKSWTVTAIRWDAVERVVLRDLADLPAGLK